MGELIASVVMLAVTVALALGLNSYNCTHKWADAGYEAVQFSYSAGCRVKKDGKWIPTSSIRNM